MGDQRLLARVRGFLLLGGRLAEILGRRGVFMAGLVVFSVGSLLCGLAWSDTALIASRALQGLGAATITPSALSILTTTFHEGATQHRARRGGRRASAPPRAPDGWDLTDLLPGVDLLRTSRSVRARSRFPGPDGERDAHGQSHDVPGAVLITSSLVLLVLGIGRAGSGTGCRPRRSASSPRRSCGVARLAAASSSARPVLDLPAPDADGGERRRVHHGHGVVLDVPDAHALHAAGARDVGPGTGGYLAVAGTAVIWAKSPPRRSNRIGVKPALIFGMSMLTLGLLLFTQVSVDGSYWADLFPGFLVLGVAIPFAFVPITIAALAGTKPQEAGSPRAHQHVAADRRRGRHRAPLDDRLLDSDDEIASTAVPSALTDGFVNAFWAGAAIAFAGVLVSIFMVRARPPSPGAAGRRACPRG